MEEFLKVLPTRDNLIIDDEAEQERIKEYEENMDKVKHTRHHSDWDFAKASNQAKRREWLYDVVKQ